MANKAFQEKFDRVKNKLIKYQVDGIKIDPGADKSVEKIVNVLDIVLNGDKLEAIHSFVKNSKCRNRWNG